MPAPYEIDPGFFRQTRRRGDGVLCVRRAAPTKYGGKRLPGSLADTGDLALISQRAEADTANAVVTQVGVRAAAQLAAVVLTGGELRGSLLLQDHRLLCHGVSPPNQRSKGAPTRVSSSRASSSV